MRTPHTHSALKPPYVVVMHTAGEVMPPQATRYHALPPIEDMPIPRIISYVEVVSPRPLEFHLKMSKDYKGPPPKHFRTIYIPNGEVFPFDVVVEGIGEANVNPEEKFRRLYKMAMKGLAYNHYFAGGVPDKIATPSKTCFVMTRDKNLWAFAENVAVLAPVDHGPDGLFQPDRRWEKVNLQQQRRLYPDELH